jgi:hypothetical protein
MEYEISCNADGYVLTSKYPVTRMIGTGADSQAVAVTENICFGKNCDAYHKLFGQGDRVGQWWLHSRIPES